MTPAPAAAPADPDAAWLARAAAGDEAAFAQLVDRHLPRLHALAWRALGSTSDAEDVAQETLLRAWRQLPSWEGGKALFSTWLHRVALNLVNDRLRARRDQVPIEDVELASHAPGPDRGADDAQRMRRVRHALQALPERQRDAVLLCHFEGLGNIEAAAALEVSVEALESLLSRARRALRQSLSDLPTDDP
jgi:RNA polymerase sigma-70 factor (ECF subfamily)